MTNPKFQHWLLEAREKLGEAQDLQKRINLTTDEVEGDPHLLDTDLLDAIDRGEFQGLCQDFGNLQFCHPKLPIKLGLIDAERVVDSLSLLVKEDRPPTALEGLGLSVLRLTMGLASQLTRKYKAVFEMGPARISHWAPVEKFQAHLDFQFHARKNWPENIHVAVKGVMPVWEKISNMEDMGLSNLSGKVALEMTISAPLSEKTLSDPLAVLQSLELQVAHFTEPVPPTFMALKLLSWSEVKPSIQNPGSYPSQESPKAVLN